MNDVEVLIRLISSASYVEDNIVWFVGTYYNALFQLDLRTMELSLFAEFVFSKKISEYQYFHCCVKHGDNIFIFPCKAQDNIKIINATNKMMTEIGIQYVVGSGARIRGVYKEGTKLYAVAFGLNEILEIDAEKLRILKSYSFCEKDFDVRGSCWRQEEKIFIFWQHLDRVLEFDLMTKELKKYHVPGMKRGIYSLGAVGKKIYLASVNKELYLWDKKSNKITNTIALPKGFGYYLKADNGNYCLDTKYDMGITFTCSEMGDKLWMIPHEGNYIMYVNAENPMSLRLYENGENSIMETRYILGSKKNAVKYYVIYTKEDRYIGIFSFLTNSVYEIDTDTNAIKKQKIQMNAEMIKFIQGRQFFYDFQLSYERGKDDVLSMCAGIERNYEVLNKMTECYIGSLGENIVGMRIARTMMD